MLLQLPIANPLKLPVAVVALDPKSSLAHCSQITNESADDQRLLSLHYPGREEDLVYGYVKEGTKGAEGMPLNVQVSQMDFAQKKE